MWLLRITAGLIACLALLASHAHGQPTSTGRTVSVTGSGPTIDEAKTDAIRQALQEELKQLIVVDRAVKGDRVLRDKVMSTMNGYIDKYRQISLRKTSKGFSIDAQITVSPSRIENFLGVMAGVGGAINGQSLFSEVNRRLAESASEKLQAQARGEIFDRSWRGFPSEAMTLKTVAVNVDHKNSNILDITVEVALKPSFVTSLEATLRALSMRVCRDPGYKYSDPMLLTPQWLLLRRKCDAPPAGNYVCLTDTRGGRCYFLEKGNYCASCDKEFIYNLLPEEKELIVFGRFVNGSGRSTQDSDCLKTAAVKNNNNSSKGVFRLRMFKWAKVYTQYNENIQFSLYSLPRRVLLQIDRSGVNLKETRFFVGVVALTNDVLFPKERSFVTSLVPDGEFRTECELVNEAVQHQLLGAN